MAGRHFDNDYVKFMKDRHREELLRLIRHDRTLLDDLLADPPSSDGFGNSYNGSRDDAIRCFLNNVRLPPKMSLSLSECIDLVNHELGFQSEQERTLWERFRLFVFSIK